MSLQSTMKQIQRCDRFGERSVTAEQVLELLEEAVWAPNHHLREPWRFIWVGKDYRGQLEDELYPSTHSELRALIREAPVCLIVASPVPQDPRDAKDDFAAVCCLIQNLQILVSASGLGMNWLLPQRKDCEAFCFAAGLQPDERIAGVLGIGHIGIGSDHASEKKIVRIDVC